MKSSPVWLTIAAAGLTAVLPGCAMLARMPPLPPQMPERALVRDLAKIVDAREQLGWSFDEIEIEGALEDALNSACRTNEVTRRRALAWIGEEILTEGGPVEEAYQRHNGDMTAIEQLLLLTRTQKLLQATEWRVRTDACPFWLWQDEDFRGLQDEGYKWLIGVEGGGRLYSNFEGKDLGNGAGGAGRALFGRGVNDRLSIFGAAEAGGFARIGGILADTRDDTPEFVVIAALLGVARYNFLSQYVQGEFGPMLYVNEHGRVLQPGLRLGFGAGASQTRVRGVMPSVGVSVAYDFAFGRLDAPPVQQLSVGLTAAFGIGL